MTTRGGITTQTKAEKIQARDFIPKSNTEAGRRILANAPPTYAFTNGKWFSGRTFVEKTMYSEGGVFRSQRPAKIDETIDLSGKYVIPPLGDAHVHWLWTKLEPDPIIPENLQEGVFYIMDQERFANTAASSRAR